MTSIGAAAGRRPSRLHLRRKPSRLLAKPSPHRPVSEGIRRHMDRRSDIGAAVIGSGFIGTVHIEALRRIGVQRASACSGRRAERAEQRAEKIGVARALRVPRRAAGRRRVDVVHVTSPNELHYPQVKADPRRRPARGVREATRDDVRGVRRARRAWRTRAAGSTRSTSTSASTRSTSTWRRWSATAASATCGWSPAATSRTGCCYDTDWNWRLEPEQGGELRAVGDIGSHWLDLMTLRDRPPRDRGHGGPGDVHPGPPQARRPGRDLLDRARRRDGAGRHPHRGRGHDPAALRGRGARPGGRLASSARAARTASSTRSTAPPPPSRGNRRSPSSCGSAIATVPTSSCSANPALMNEPGARPRASRRATSRASPTRSARCSWPSTRTSLAGRPAESPRYADVRGRPRRDARRRRDRARAPNAALGVGRPRRQPARRRRGSATSRRTEVSPR